MPPNRRAHDLDNCLARMKSGLDGLADVLGVDDKHWTLTISKADTVGGMVKVEVRHAWKSHCTPSGPIEQARASFCSALRPGAWSNGA